MAPFETLNRQYLYDQLNRLVQADYAWVDSVGDFNIDEPHLYQTKYRYDADGNLKSLVRYGFLNGFCKWIGEDANHWENVT